MTDQDLIADLERRKTEALARQPKAGVRDMYESAFGAGVVDPRVSLTIDELDQLLARAAEDKAECEAVRRVLEPVFFDGLGAVWGATTDELVAYLRGLGERLPASERPHWQQP